MYDFFEKKYKEMLYHFQSIVFISFIIGEFEYGFNLKTYMQTAICIEPTSAYILGGRNFERLIQSRRNPDGLKQIREIAERNILYRINRPIDSKIPLFRCLVKQIYEANLQVIEFKSNITL